MLLLGSIAGGHIYIYMFLLSHRITLIKRCHKYARRCHIYARRCHIYARRCHIYALEGGPFFFLKKLQKSGIFIIYMGSSRAKYNDIAASTSAFFSSVKKLPRELSVPSGLRPSGTDSSPRQFFTSKKMPRSRGYIVVYSPP